VCYAIRCILIAAAVTLIVRVEAENPKLLAASTRIVVTSVALRALAFASVIIIAITFGIVTIVIIIIIIIATEAADTVIVAVDAAQVRRSDHRVQLGHAAATEQ
jgi:hypothetical protein